MTTAPLRHIFIRGLTREGRAFRPSDWSERLAGAMSSFRPGASSGAAGRGGFIGYSPYCMPQLIDGVRCVIVDERLRGLEPKAWDFVINFGRDNGLEMTEAELLPDGTYGPVKPFK
jgi:hypothetical protein